VRHCALQFSRIGFVDQTGSTLQSVVCKMRIALCGG
jgi:hypothetical protein